MKSLVVGQEIYRFQYSGDFRFPHADVEFQEFCEFADNSERGAEPDVKGMHMLRMLGPWTPRRRGY